MSVVVAWWLLAMLSVSVSTEDLSFSVDTKRYSHVVSERFLSITIDPALLMDAEYSSGITKVMNLARGLAPAYVRIGSPASNSYHFHKAGTHRQQNNASYTVTEAQWMILNDFAQKSGLEPIVCVNIMSRQGGAGTWDTRNLQDLVAYSDRRKYKLAWQMGYELQRYKNQLSGAELGNDVKTLRNILDSFPRYQQSKLLGPDIVSTNDPSDLKFLRDFLHSAGNALSAVTWHAFENNGVQFDGETNTLVAGENALADQLGKEFTSKPLWIAESYRDPGQPNRFEDALSWAVKLGEAARIGVQTVLKRPQIHNLHTPTPDYWVSFLHKTLVGEVILTNDWVPSGEVHMFSHCTNTRKPASNVFVNDQLRYEGGSMTFFGVNWLPTQVNISLRLSALTKRSRDVELHEYILTPDNMQSPLMFKMPASQVPKVLLNGRPLSLDFTGRLPILTPRVHHYTNRMALTLPAGSVGFWVVSGAKVRACTVEDGGYQDEEGPTRVRRSAEEVDLEPSATEAPEKTSKVTKKKPIPSSQIVMEIGNWKEGTSKTKDSDKTVVDKNNNAESDVLEESNVAERSIDEIASEVHIITPEITSEHLGNHEDKYNGTDLDTLDEENTKKTKYRISKVLVVFENELEDQKNESHEEDKRALLVDEETMVSSDKEFSRVSRALEKDAFPITSLPLSLLDVAALREPLISLKRLRERRWEQLQRKKLLAAKEYTKTLGLQASMLFPKKWISGVPVPKLSLVQPKILSEEQTNDYDYISEEEPEEEYSQQHTSQGQWNTQNSGMPHGALNTQGQLNTQNSGIPHSALNQQGQMWDVQRGLMDGSPLQEHQRYIREYPEEIHTTDEEESGQNESPEKVFIYGTRHVRESERTSKKKRKAHSETKQEDPTFQYLGETDIPHTRSSQEKRPYVTVVHDYGCFGNAYSRHPADRGSGELYHKPTSKRADLEPVEHQSGNKRARHAQPLNQRESYRDRRHLTDNRGTNVKDAQELLTDMLTISDDQEITRVRKDVSASPEGNDGATPSEQPDENIEQDSTAVAEEEIKGSSHKGKHSKSSHKNKNRKRDGNEMSNTEKHSDENVASAGEQNIEERDANGNDGQGYWDWDDKSKGTPLKLIPIIKPIHLPKHFPLPKLSPLKPYAVPKALPVPKLIPISKLLPKARQYNGYEYNQQEEKKLLPIVLPKFRPLPKYNPSSVPSLHGKFAHFVSDLKSKTHSKLDELDKKKILPLRLGKSMPDLSQLKESMHDDLTNLKESMPDLHNLKQSMPDLSQLKESMHDDLTNLKQSMPDLHNLKQSMPDLSQLKEKFEVLKQSAASKVYPQPDKRDDEEVSQVDPDATGHDAPDKRDDDEASKARPEVALHKLSEKLTTLRNSILRHPEPSIVERSTESKSPQQDVKDETVTNPEDMKHVISDPKISESADKVKEKVEENAEKVEDQLLESTVEMHHGQTSELQAETNLEDVDHNRMKRNTHDEDKSSHNKNHIMLSTGKGTQHSKKRFLKLKDLQALDSPKHEDDPAKSTDNSRGGDVIHVAPPEEEVISCRTNSIHGHIPGPQANAQPTTDHGSSKCINQQDHRFTITHLQHLPTLPRITDERSTHSGNKQMHIANNLHNKLNNDQVQKIRSVEDQNPSSKDSDSSKTDDSKSKKLQLKNNGFKTWRSIQPANFKENKGIKSGNWHLIKPIQQNLNVRLKRYIDVFSGEIDSKDFLNEKLTMVDSNSNEPSEEEEKFRKTLSAIEKAPSFIIDKLKHNTGIRDEVNLNADHDVLDSGKKSGNVDRVFKDWNLEFGPHGLQIEAEQAQDTQAFQGIGRTWRYEHKTNPTDKYKELKTAYYSTQKTPSGVSIEASQKLGFFGNFLKKIYSLFHLVFNKATK